MSTIYPQRALRAFNDPMYMKAFTIHSASVENFDQIYLIEKQCYSRPWSELMLKAELESAHSLHFLILGSENSAVGFVLTQLIADEIHIHNIAVLPDFQKRGLAKKLLQHLLISAEKKGAVKALLEVRSSNVSALGLYSVCGFKTEGLRKNYYRDGEDALLMTRVLKK